MIYLDSSALVKLAVEEPESGALRMFLHNRHEQERVTSALARVEVGRAVRSRGDAAVAQAAAVLQRTDSIPMSVDLLDEAVGLGDHLLRTLDAIHIASALRLGDELTELVAYDQRLLDAAARSGIRTAAPR